MALAGFRKNCLRTGGGIESVRLVEAGQILQVRYDAVNDRYTGIELREGAGFVQYRFAEDEALYREQLAVTGGKPLVRHELSFVLTGMNSASRKAVEEMAAAGGLAALVENRQGEILLVGWSERFGAEQPLRMDKSVGTTRSAPGEVPSETIVLSAADTEKAKPFTGEIPQSR